MQPEYNCNICMYVLIELQLWRLSASCLRGFTNLKPLAAPPVGSVTTPLRTVHLREAGSFLRNWQSLSWWTISPSRMKLRFITRTQYSNLWIQSTSPRSYFFDTVYYHSLSTLSVPVFASLLVARLFSLCILISPCKLCTLPIPSPFTIIISSVEHKLLLLSLRSFIHPFVTGDSNYTRVANLCILKTSEME
jgi:hypothetical protein